ncbi:enoyl-CoA hydratase [Zavarzinia sp. CC-PAN008]|uniref:enoyl-CoA hydratase n=1 Tax=Zavarzinia sp. CC-PAN008 TaxID=3243332 RepID=UPI003F7432BE
MGGLVLSQVDDGVATLVLNRPQARNSLSGALMAALQAALDACAADPAIRVVVIAGTGPAFCAGHDLRELTALADAESLAELFAQCSRLMQAIRAQPQPVIARVHGIATAAGCQLVASCDLAVAAADARFATPGVNIGLFCSTPMVALSRAVGTKQALDMLLTGDAIDAATAERWGLVNRVVAPDVLETATTALARQIASKPAAVVAQGKALFYRQQGLDLPQAYEAASLAMVHGMLAPEAAEGIGAFLARRAPIWPGQ